MADEDFFSPWSSVFVEDSLGLISNVETWAGDSTEVSGSFDSFGNFFVICDKDLSFPRIWGI
jgi:hypothetical protein